MSMSEELQEVVRFLKTYDGPEIRLMEVCGTHTAAISTNGIPSMLSPKIHLISGPGCPVCVTVTSVIDKLCELAMQPDTTVLSFGDLLRVPGSDGSLADVKAQGGSVEMVYSPLDLVPMARENPERNYVFAAIGFETTTPVYATLLQQVEEEGIRNLRLLTSLKTMPEVIRWVCRNTATPIDGFLAPGHVSVITGAGLFEDLAQELGIPFVVVGFDGPHLLMAIYTLIRLRGRGEMRNLFPTAVSMEGNRKARELVERYFMPQAASWRGMGSIPGSGMILKPEYAALDAGSQGLEEDRQPKGCCCAKVLTGALSPRQCPLFGKTCTPMHAHGACMVSTEGSCYNYFVSGRMD